MGRSSPRGFAVLMVAATLFLFSCAHGASTSGHKAPVESGVQSAAPPKAAVQAAPVEVAAVKPELILSLPEGWTRVPKASLHPDHDFAIISVATECSIFGYLSSNVPGTLPEYLAFRGARGKEQGFTLSDPVFAEDMSWGMLSMEKEGIVIVFGLKMVVVAPPRGVFVYGRANKASAAELEATMASTLETISCAPSAPLAPAK